MNVYGLRLVISDENTKALFIIFCNAFLLHDKLVFKI